MKKYLTSFVIAAMAGAFPAVAQDHGGGSFEDFRKKLLGDYQEFRKSVLEDYDKYLDGIWTEFESFHGKAWDPAPKPVTPPAVDPAEETPEPVVLPVPNLPMDIDAEEPDVTVPDMSPLDIAPVQAPPLIVRPFLVDFYALSLQFPEISLRPFEAAAAQKDYGQLWRAFSAEKVEDRVVPYIREYASQHRLNDWFVFELTRAYADKLLAGLGRDARVSLTHYLLCHIGYNARLGKRGEDKPILLIPFRQTVYARSFVKIGGMMYYIFTDSQDEPDEVGSGAISTCPLPQDADLGAVMDLVIREELNIPFAPHPYSISYGGLSLSGEVNRNLMPMLYRYPQMPVGDYERSTVSRKVREEIEAQLHRQLDGKPQLDAVNSLLQFIQSGFDYATDDELHGFEKPYFLEEILYYPQCDCEDRSIFYSYLLQHVLGVESQLLGFPGHASVGVHLDEPIRGDSYQYEGKTFYISDPTYIGSLTGMCPREFRAVNPEIQFVWDSSR